MGQSQSQSRLPALFALSLGGAGLSWWLWRRRRQPALDGIPQKLKPEDVTANSAAQSKSKESVSQDQQSGASSDHLQSYSLSALLTARRIASEVDLGFSACPLGEATSTSSQKVEEIVLDPVHGTRPVVYCDLDGVLCDFENAVSRLFRRPYPQIKKAVMWKRLSETWDFYAQLPWLDEGWKLWESLQSVSPVILSGVPQDWGSIASGQKRKWVRRELGEQVPILTCLKDDKWKVCRPGDILIDDNADLRESWENAGGIFIHHVGNALASVALLTKVGALPPPAQLRAVRWVQVRWENDWWWCKLLSEEKQGANVQFMEPPHVGYKFLAPTRALRRTR